MTVYHFVTGIFHLKVPESSQVGSAIGRIRAVDPDFGKNAEIEYNIVPGDGGNLFDITTDENTQEGVIKLKKVCGTNGGVCTYGSSDKLGKRIKCCTTIPHK